MRNRPRLTRMFLLSIVAVLGNTWVIQRAHADTVNAFTGSWSVEFGGQYAFMDRQGFSGLTVLFGSDFVGFFSSYPSISNYSDNQGCRESLPCRENWSGTFDDGSVSLDVYDLQGSNSPLNVHRKVYRWFFFRYGGLQHHLWLFRPEPSNI